jgi:hypothetical protein
MRPYLEKNLSQKKGWWHGSWYRYKKKKKKKNQNQDNLGNHTETALEFDHQILCMIKSRIG